MPTEDKRTLLGLEDVHALCDKIALELRGDAWIPEIIIGLSRGGLYPAMRLAELLGVQTVIGLPVRKTEGVRYIDDVAQLTREGIAHKRVLGVDDAIITGKLLGDLQFEVDARHDGKYRCAALVGVGNYLQLPHLYVAAAMQSTPRFFWEVPGRG